MPAATAAAAALWARPSPVRGMPKDSRRRRDASGPRGEALVEPASVSAVAASLGRRLGMGLRERNDDDACWYRAKARRAVKQLRNDRNNGTPASMSVLNPASSVLKE